jgi:hypothetical protein
MTEIAALRRKVVAIRKAVDAIDAALDEIDAPEVCPDLGRPPEARSANDPQAADSPAEARETELTLEDVAKRLRMQPVTLRKFLRRIRFFAIQAGDTLLFTESDYIAVRDARRKVRTRSTGAAVAAPGPAPASSADVQRRLAKLRADSVQRRSSGKRSAAAPDAELQKLREEYWPQKGKSKTSSGRRGRVVVFPKRP